MAKDKERIHLLLKIKRLTPPPVSGADEHAQCQISSTLAILQMAAARQSVVFRLWLWLG
jgi:hypothetical protein